MLLDKYILFIEKEVFPNGLQSLRKCKNSNDVKLWKDMIKR